MLMSVTERFREIGTMKCLGALDGFIIRLFLIESFVLGSLGSIAGALLGHGVMLLVYCIREGFSLAGKLDWPIMLTSLVGAVAVGGVLALLAAVPPSVVAAKLPPAAALRTEV
ncbi:MAG: FtsX-like permease family protein, partial [Armatimonadota bacterium]